MIARDFVGRTIVVLSLWLCSTLPATAQGVGAIGRHRFGSSGAVLPGVSVSLSNPRGSIGGNQETVTDARGAFQFIRLVPGVYTVKADSGRVPLCPSREHRRQRRRHRAGRSEAGDRHALGRHHREGRIAAAGHDVRVEADRIVP